MTISPHSPAAPATDAAPGGPAIDMTDLGYRYARGREPALTELTLTLRPGTITGLLGRNGSSKTTELRKIQEKKT